VSSTPHASPSTVASPFFCPVGLGQKEKDGKKERRVPVIDNGLLRARGEHNTPFHRAISHCLSADELPRLTRPRRPLLACIIKPVITPVRRAVCITLFCTSKVLDVVSPLPASLQSAALFFLPMPSYVDLPRARLCNHVVSRHIKRWTACLLSMVPWPGEFG
jgi:hypothetical protein